MSEVDDINELEYEPGVHVDNDNVELGALGSQSIAGENDIRLSRDIDEAVTRSVVSNVNMDRVSDLEEGTAYLIDFSGSSCTLVPSWMRSLKNMIVSNELNGTSDKIEEVNALRKKRGEADLRADAAMYIKAKSGTVTLVGYVDTLQCYKLLRDMVHVSIGEAVKIYVKRGVKAKFEEWKSTDVKGVRLRL